jgi:fucose 4-O-acetylase-like acetyltransferase
LAPARVAIGILWFAAIYMVYRAYEKPISKYTYGVLEVFGRQSLFVYTFHAFILFILELYFIPPVGHTIGENTLVTLTVIAIVYVAAYYRGHVTTIGKRLLANRSTTQVP